MGCAVMLIAFFARDGILGYASAAFERLAVVRRGGATPRPGT
jgi:hypothetical protein